MVAEGITKFQAAHTHGDLPAEAQDRFAPIGAWRRIFFMLGLIGADPARYGGLGFGNVSCRMGPYPGERRRRRFVITGTQTSDRWELGPDKLCVVEAYDPKANWVQSQGPVRPSSESLTHGALYDLSPRIRSVLQVGFQRLDLAVAMAQHRIELEFDQCDQAHPMASILGGGGVALGEGTAQAVAVGMAEQDQDGTGHGNLGQWKVREVGLCPWGRVNDQRRSRWVPGCSHRYRSAATAAARR